MPYTVQFVGLVCFYREKGGGRQALLPDGQNPGKGIDPHFASIIVEREAVQDETEWNGDKKTTSDTTTFSLRLPSTVTLEGVEESGTLDTREHDNRLPQLGHVYGKFEINPERAGAIARVPIRRGTLTAYTIPGGTAVISQLDVPHDGPIRITVTPRDGSKQRTIVLRPGTEIAVTNMAKNYEHASADQEVGHFRIYERLSSTKHLSPRHPPTERNDVPPSPTQHAMFRRPKPISLTVNCSNTGCCAG